MFRQVPKFLSVAILIAACLPVIILFYPGIKELYGANIEEYFAKHKVEKNKRQCNSIGGYWMEPNYWDFTIEARCIPPYADQNMPCKYSNQCQGSCVATIPNIKDYTGILENCSRLENTEVRGYSVYTENYSCPNIKFEGRCSKFKWQRNPELNGSKISDHIEALDLEL
ncbi:MAG: hypothetical protein HYT15_04165 [Candidatus Magasanikbacteria bacterium]|nr:hypothetical protein [Candidatus Magasanikbacteria bacterium]